MKETDPLGTCRCKGLIASSPSPKKGRSLVTGGLHLFQLVDPGVTVTFDKKIQLVESGKEDGKLASKPLLKSSKPKQCDAGWFCC